MMKNRAGFSVIEFIISIMISAMLMTAALTIYRQISKSMLSIQQITHADTTALIVKNRLTLDVLGLCPLWFPAEKKESSSTEKPTPASTNENENRYLYAVSNNNQLQYLTFVTSSTLASYTTPQNRYVRVVYALKPDPQHPDRFMLQRKQDSKVSHIIDSEKMLEGDFYTLAKNISKCTLEYGFIELSPSQRLEKKDSEWKIKWNTSWNPQKKESKSSKGKSTDDQSEDYEPKTPEIIRITLTLHQYSNDHGRTYELYCPLSINTSITLKPFAAQPEPKTQSPTPQPSPTGQSQPIVQPSPTPSVPHIIINKDELKRSIKEPIINQIQRQQIISQFRTPQSITNPMISQG